LVKLHPNFLLTETDPIARSTKETTAAPRSIFNPSKVQGNARSEL
jgi:hypothetical protein